MDSRPNILLLIADQFRGDCLSIENHPVLSTPNLDDLAAQGVFFHRAYSTCPSCIPARRALLTGLHPAANGLVGMEGGHTIETPTLPGELRRAGYQTAFIGRMMHQHPATARYGYEHFTSTYFDSPDDEYGKDLARAPYGPSDLRGSGISNNGWTARPWHLDESLHPTNWVTRKNREFLRSADETCPLFLTASFQGPHPPLTPPAFYMERYLRCELAEPRIGAWTEPPPLHSGIEARRVHLQGERLRNTLAGYFGMINHLDDQLYWLIGEFMQRSRNLQREWLVVFTSDHGEMLGDHYLFRKCEPYEGSARIPFIFRASPGLRFAAGIRVDSPVCLEDLFPTLAELAGLKEGPSVDGHSLVPVLRGESTQVRTLLHGEHARQYADEQAHHFVTDGCWKYIWRPLTGVEQLFDLRTDPFELQDLSTIRIDKKSFFRNELVDILKGRPEGFVNSRGDLQTVQQSPRWIGPPLRGTSRKTSKISAN